MSLQGIVTPMQFSLVKASIASLLTTERDNQLVLLAAAGKTDADIDNNYYFSVFKDLFILPDAEDLPCVNVYNARGAFDSGRGYTDSKWHTYSLAVDCYSISCAEPGARADALAANRLDYLWGQVFKMLCSEENWHKGLQSVVRAARFTDWAQKLVSVGGKERAQEILAIQATLELQFNEPTETVLGEPLERIVADLEIDGQFISPYISAEYV